MLEQNEYLVTWAVYYGAALGVLLVWWRMTKPIPWVPLKQLLRVLLAAAVLVPAPLTARASSWRRPCSYCCSICC